MILLIDNYDSFAHNLARYFVRLGHQVRVVRNDAITCEEIEELQPDAIVLSPGPCTPKEAGISLEVVGQFYQRVPMLGVCLGHQTIAAALGAKIVRCLPMHGRVSEIQHDGRGVFADMPQPLTVCRYHSLIVDESSLPPELEVTARTADGLIMAFAHRSLPVVGWQFHPEAALTSEGYNMLAAFLHLATLPTPAELPDGEIRRPPVRKLPPHKTSRPLTF